MEKSYSDDLILRRNGLVKYWSSLLGVWVETQPGNIDDQELATWPKCDREAIGRHIKRHGLWPMDED